MDDLVAELTDERLSTTLHRRAAARIVELEEALREIKAVKLNGPEYEYAEIACRALGKPT